MTIVVSPLLALIQDQVMSLLQRPCGGVPAAYLTSTLTNDQANAIFLCVGCRCVPLPTVHGARCPRSDLEGPKPTCKILYLTPEKLDLNRRMRDMIQSLYSRGLLSRIVFDECHCVVQWGHDFRKSYLIAGTHLQQLCPAVPKMALTATATPALLEEIKALLHMQGCRMFQQSFNRPNLTYRVLPSVRCGLADPGQRGVPGAGDRRRQPALGRRPERAQGSASRPTAHAYNPTRVGACVCVGGWGRAAAGREEQGAG